jgi:hypothetical protein
MIFSSPTTYLPTYLFTYIFALATSLPTRLLGRYILDPTYMAKPTYLINIPIDATITKNDEAKKKESIA